MKTVYQSLAMYILFTAITGLAYPAFVTLAAQALFHKQANGSLIYQHGQVRGSELLGQEFAGPGYFWPRPSATSPSPYNGGASSGSNYGPLNPDLHKRIREQVALYRNNAVDHETLVPVDLVTSSGSGLDPHISLAAAQFQLPRVASERYLPEEVVQKLVQQYTQDRQFGFLGEPRVNVLQLNLALDQLK